MIANHDACKGRGTATGAATPKIHLPVVPTHVKERDASKVRIQKPINVRFHLLQLWFGHGLGRCTLDFIQQIGLLTEETQRVISFVSA